MICSGTDKNETTCKLVDIIFRALDRVTVFVIISVGFCF